MIGKLRWMVFLLAVGLATPVVTQSEKKPAEKKPAAKPAGQEGVGGLWNIVIDSPQGSASPEMHLAQEGEKVTGQYKGMFGESKLSGTFKDGELKFTVAVNAQGTDLVLTYTGRLEKDGTLKGTLAAGDLGGADWKATRAPKAEGKK